MKFLEKIIESINVSIESLIQKLLSLVPGFIFQFIEKVKHFPAVLKHFISVAKPKLTAFFKSIADFFLQYITIARGQFTGAIIYLRSEEFKQAKKSELILNQITYIKNNPLKITYSLSIVSIFIVSFYFITLNTSKIVVGTKSRAPASAVSVEVIDDTIFEIHHHKFEVVVGGGVHHGEEILTADIKLKLVNAHKKELIEELEPMIDDYLEAMEIKAPAFPIDDATKATIEANILKELNEGLMLFAHDAPIVKVELVFHQHSRPEYYRKSDRSYSLANVDFQVFEEDLKRNHQVYIDFTVVASNRNIVNFLKTHEELIRDRLSTNVEPILPHLPIEDEGKRIIKDKIRDELNSILIKENIEGRILEVYFNFSMSS